MDTYLVYFDEAGDDGNNTSSCDHFVLTSIYMPISSWHQNYDKIKRLRIELRNQYGLHVAEEMHTKAFLTDKNPYRGYNWTKEARRDILNRYMQSIAELDMKIINVVIDKTRVSKSDYNVLESALTYNLQRIENDSHEDWRYLVITDKGRLVPMRNTARKLCAYNPIPSMIDCSYINKPLVCMVEDIMEKDSSESYFIQICDFISYFVHLYFDCCIKKKELPKRVAELITPDSIVKVLGILVESGKLNLKANSRNEYGIVIYPRA